MGDQKKGFDPLASLFDGPDLQALPEVDEDEVPTMLGTEADVSGLYTPFLGGLRSVNVPEATDVPEPRGVTSPTMVPEPPAPAAPVPPAPAPAAEPPAAESEAITEGTAAPTPELAAPAPPEAPAPEDSTPQDSTPQDRAALAKRLAAEAIARAQAAAPPAPPAEDKAALAKRLAAEAIARAAAKAPAPPAEDKAALARRLAAEAIARAKARPQAPASATKPAPKKKKKSRLSLAERASRPTSAADAMRNAKAREDQARQEKTAAAVSQLPQYVANLLATRIRGVSSLKVVNAVVMNDREILLALWKGHRARLAAQGDLAECVAITQVIGALGAVEQGRLIAAIAETSASDYLVWIDASHNHVIAAFPNAREWYSKLAG